MKQITITRVVSKNFIMDIVALFQNLIGHNLTSYEKMVEKAMQQIQKEVNEKKIKFKWYRYEITQLTKGALAVMLYGDAL